MIEHADDLLHALTPWDREVLGLMAEGHSNTTIGSLLVISDRLSFCR